MKCKNLVWDSTETFAWNHFHQRTNKYAGKCHTKCNSKVIYTAICCKIADALIMFHTATLMYICLWFCFQTFLSMILNFLVYVVWASEHDGNPLQLHHIGHVSAMRRWGMYVESLPSSAGLRRSHLRLLRHRDAYQDDRHGLHGTRGLYVWLMEQARLLHRLRRVSYISIIFSFYLTLPFSKTIGIWNIFR